MKPLPPPEVPGKTESEKFDNAVRTIFSVPKAEIEKREAEWQRERKSARDAEENLGHEVGKDNASAVQRDRHVGPGKPKR
jgi:hypothetical protein